MKEKTYNIRLARRFDGGWSRITIPVEAVSKAQAIRKAEVELPGWTVETEEHLAGG